MYNPQLETFMKVADCGSFNKAAEELYISPPCGHKTGESAGICFESSIIRPHPQRTDSDRSRKIIVS